MEIGASMLIVYFHASQSCSRNYQVERLKRIPGSRVISFLPDMDPTVAIERIGQSIDMALLDDMHSPEPVVFVGSSLGAWLASALAHLYDIPAVLINPAFDPAPVLARHGVPERICQKYFPIRPRPSKDVYFFAERDTVIPNTLFRASLKARMFVDSSADHCFDNEPFEAVCKFLETNFSNSAIRKLILADQGAGIDVLDKMTQNVFRAD